MVSRIYSVNIAHNAIDREKIRIQMQIRIMGNTSNLSVNLVRMLKW